MSAPAKTALHCSGRPVDDRLAPVGKPCGKRLRWTSGWTGCSGELQQALAAGWSVAPDGTATCPACRRPAPEVVALVREVGR